MNEVKIAIGEPKWPNDKDRAIGHKFAQKYPSIYWMVRESVKEKHTGYVSQLVEKAMERGLPRRIAQIRFAEYITRLAYSELKAFCPMMWNEIRIGA